MNMPHDEKWIDRATALLDQSTQSLDAATLSRLNRARQAALAERRRAVRSWALGAGLAGAAAVAMVVAVGLHHRFGASDPAPGDAATLQPADIDFLTNDDDTPELYENLDFYAWLGAKDGGKRG